MDPTDRIPVELLIYDTDFDSLLDKAGAMTTILDTLPPIATIRRHLQAHANGSLRTMDLLSPAATTLLEWIVASNRSCIFQMNPPSDESGPAAESASGGRPKDRVVGMPGWTQFMFAQGAPDKELRFNNALQEVMTRRRLKYPTLFAWAWQPAAQLA